MKNMKVSVLRFALAAAVCSAVFFAVIFTVLKTDRIEGVSLPKTDEPYTPQISAQTMTLLINFKDGYGLILKLDFENKMISSVLLKGELKSVAEGYGYFADETLNCDYLFLAEFIDALGGIDMKNQNAGNSENAEKIRYTGIQIADLVSKNTDDIALKKDILTAILSTVAKYGFPNEALSCIIRSDTTLSYPDCYLWESELPALCKTLNFVNG